VNLVVDGYLMFPPKFFVFFASSLEHVLTVGCGPKIEPRPLRPISSPSLRKPFFPPPFLPSGLTIFPFTMFCFFLVIYGVIPVNKDCSDSLCAAS